MSDQVSDNYQVKNGGPKMSDGVYDSIQFCSSGDPGRCSADAKRVVSRLRKMDRGINKGDCFCGSLAGVGVRCNLG